jgi:putative transposase
MARATPRWGAPRIHGELQKLGLEIAQATVFFTVPTVLFKVLFVFVVLAHNRRRVVQVNVTDAPTARGTAQQRVEAFPWDTAPRDLLRDRDAIDGAVFSRQVQALAILEVKIASRAPWQCRTPHRHLAPRVPRSRRGLNATHRRRLLRDYLLYSHSARTHLSLAKDAPEPRAVERLDQGRIVETPWSAASITDTGYSLHSALSRDPDPSYAATSPALPEGAPQHFPHHVRIPTHPDR